MQSQFAKLVRYMKKKYKLNQRDIAYWLGVHETSVSNCIHSKQGNTGERFIPRLKELIERFEPSKVTPVSVPLEHVEKTVVTFTSPVTQQNVSHQNFIPSYKLGSILCCHKCYTQQEATKLGRCHKCGEIYNFI